MQAASNPLAAWVRHDLAWRDPAQVVGLWDDGAKLDPRLLRFKATRDWWDLLSEQQICLLVSREYEHLLLAVSCVEGRPRFTYLRMPHPSGIAADRRRGRVHVASTRNPNQLIELAPVHGLLARADVEDGPSDRYTLVPVRTTFLPGALYIHDLAFVGSQLHFNAVGANAVARLGHDGRARLVWWPRTIDSSGGPRTERNYIQLNSIAAGATLADSYFSASADRISGRRPGQRNFRVDRRGVVFSGRTREPVARGLTRPHSARLRRNHVWVLDSGYGHVGVIEGGRFESVAGLPGWTRGLTFRNGIAFVGTSRVIPRFTNYAPGLSVETSQCAVHAVEAGTGKVLASLTWPYGNQVFAVEWVPTTTAQALPFDVSRNAPQRRARRLFYAFDTTRRTSDG